MRKINRISFLTIILFLVFSIEIYPNIYLVWGTILFSILYIKYSFRQANMMDGGIDFDLG